MNNCLLSIDLNTTRLNNQNYNYLIKSLPNCNLTIHIYNYIEQKHNKLPFNHNEIIHQYIGSRKKVALDIPQALDIVEICAKNKFDKVFILCGEYESEFLYNKLSNMKINFCKILPSTLRQTEENSIVKVEINNNNLDDKNIFNDNFHLYDNSQNSGQNNNEAIQYNNLHNVDNLKTEIATTATDNLQQFKLLNANDNLNEITNNIKNNDDKETIDLKVLKENFEQIINSKQKNEAKANQTASNTKLTPEQIKKIYAFVKYRKLIRQI